MKLHSLTFFFSVAAVTHINAIGLCVFILNLDSLDDRWRLYIDNEPDISSNKSMVARFNLFYYILII